jgi:hypothetical protein
VIPIDSSAASSAVVAEATPDERLQYATILVEIGELWDAEAEVVE